MRLHDASPVAGSARKPLLAAIVVLVVLIGPAYARSNEDNETLHQQLEQLALRLQTLDESDKFAGERGRRSMRVRGNSGRLTESSIENVKPYFAFKLTPQALTNLRFEFATLKVLIRRYSR